VLVLGAVSVTAAHVVHIRRGRTTSMRVRSDDPRPGPKHPAPS
jgi:hypothetical protein